MRLFAASMFILLRIFWMSLLINLTSSALLIMMGVDLNYLPLLMTGDYHRCTRLYHTRRHSSRYDHGCTSDTFAVGWGLKVILTVSLQGNGFSWFPTRWQPEIWDSQPVFSANLSTRVTVFGTVLTTLYMVLSDANRGSGFCSAIYGIEGYLPGENLTFCNKSLSVGIGRDNPNISRFFIVGSLPNQPIGTTRGPVFRKRY